MNTLTLGDVKGLGQTNILDTALQPYIETLKRQLAELATPAAKQATLAAVPIIREEFNKWIPTIALLIGVSIGASMLIGTQLPRWSLGRKGK